MEFLQGNKIHSAEKNLRCFGLDLYPAFLWFYIKGFVHDLIIDQYDNAVSVCDTFDRIPFTYRMFYILAPAESKGVFPARFSSPPVAPTARSEEHTSEVQSRGHFVSRHLL